MKARGLIIGTIAAFSLWAAACGKDNGGSQPAGKPDAGTDGGVDGSYTYPDPGFIFEVRQPAVSAADDPYEEEFSDQYRTVDRLAILEVRAMAYVGGALWAATADGLFRKADGDEIFTAVTLPGNPASGEIVAIARGAYSDRVAAALADRVELFEADGTAAESIAFEHGPIRCLAAGETVLAAGTADGIYLKTGGGWERIEGSAGIEIRDLSVRDDAIYAATAAGVKIFPLGGGEPHEWTAAAGDLPDDDVRSVAACGERVVAASFSGIAVHDADDVIQKVAEPGGLPTDNLVSIDCSENGIIIGHAVGGTYLPADLSRADHYVSGRWLPDNAVKAVALAGRDRWFGAAAGASRIHLVGRKLADKEKVMNDLVPHFYRMDGVSGAFMSAGGSAPSADSQPDEIRNGDHDNDGLWTQMMVGGWCFAYAQTGDEQYYEKARLAMNNMERLVDLPGPVFEEAGFGRGFVARSLVREDETDLYQPKIDQAEKVSEKDILLWRPTTDGAYDYLFKGDTSSDETTGHFFGFPIFYDLCAKTAGEKAEVAERAGAITDYILRNGLFLMDLDGTKTTHGHWAPNYLSIAVDGMRACIDNGNPGRLCAEAAGGGGWLNTIEILGYMLAAYHMTGEKKFYDAYEALIREHRYDEVAMANEQTLTITDPAIANHSDHELAMLAYTTLIRYDANEGRRAKWIESLKFLYDRERPERNPWWTAVYALSGGQDPDVEAALRTLREMPDDRREWRVDNRHRKDATIRVKDRHQNDQFDRVFPYDELRVAWWNGNFYSVAGGGDGRNWSAPTAWLLPYYMARYAGLIE